MKSFPCLLWVLGNLAETCKRYSSLTAFSWPLPWPVDTTDSLSDVKQARILCSENVFKNARNHDLFYHSAFL